MKTKVKTKPNAKTIAPNNAGGTAADHDDEPPADIDAFRNALARRISRFLGDRQRAWRTCKEPACRRHRCCQAPRIQCSNAPPPKPDPDGRRVARALAQVQRVLREVQGR